MVVTARKLVQELRPRLFRFAEKEHVEMVAIGLRMDRHPGSADPGEDPALAEHGRDAERVIDVARVSRHADEVVVDVDE